MAGAIGKPSIQVHITRTCNLQCLHCYSESGPEVRESLEVEGLCRFIEDARTEGYEVLAFSGGEPLLYPHLNVVLECAKKVGFITTLTSNGTLLTGNRWDAVRDHLDLIAVSIDGPPELHNHIRATSSAFARMESGLQRLRSDGVKFGLVHTLTRASLPHLKWLAEYAAEAGASLLQLHPLGQVGNGRTLDSLALDGELMARMYLAGLAIKARYASAFETQIDLFNRAAVQSRPELVYAHPMCGEPVGPLSDWLNPLILMSNGDLSPVCHGMPQAFRLGNIYRRPFDEIARSYLAKGYDDLRSHCTQLWADLVDQLEWPYFNWYECLERGAAEDHRPVALTRDGDSIDSGAAA